MFNSAKIETLEKDIKEERGKCLKLDMSEKTKRKSGKTVDIILRDLKYVKKGVSFLEGLK